MATSTFQQLKLEIVSATGLSKDLLHLHIGMVLFLFVLVVAKRPIGSLLPVVVILIAAAIGEIMDMRDDLISLGEWRWKASVRDVVGTVLWPTVVTLLARSGMLRCRDYRAANHSSSKTEND